MAGALTPVGSMAPHEAATAWGADPLAVAAVLGLGWAYALGLGRLRARAGGSRPLARWRPRAFAAGLVALLLALASPLDPLGETLLSAHMAQHLLLMTAAPPLLIAGRTVMVCAWALPSPRREALHRWLRGLRRRSLRSGPVAGAVVGGYLLVLWGWHLPAAYETAVRSPVVHALEHATMFGAALLLWWSVLRRGVARYGAGVLALALTGAGGGALAALLTFSERAWYGVYDPAAAGWPLSALDDQQLAGAVLWVVGGLAHAAAAAVLFAWWLRALDRRARPPRTRLRAAGTGAVLAVAAGVALAACQPDTDPGSGAEATVARGREAVVEHGCVACHAIEGVDTPQGRVGPSLHDVSEREALAGQLPNTPENLVRWIVDPQGIDPGNLMPDLDVSESDAEAIVRFLDSLE